jgi:hypothetical protein
MVNPAERIAEKMALAKLNSGVHPQKYVFLFAEL